MTKPRKRRNRRRLRRWFNKPGDVLDAVLDAIYEWLIH